MCERLSIIIFTYTKKIFKQPKGLELEVFTQRNRYFSAAEHFLHLSLLKKVIDTEVVSCWWYDGGDAVPDAVSSHGVGTDERGLLISETITSDDNISFPLRQGMGVKQSTDCVGAGIPQARTGR